VVKIVNIFLVDYENVSISGLDGTKLLKKKDKIYIFYSVKTKDVSMDIIDNLIKSKADFKLFKLTKTAKNALDFQLVLFLGTRLRKYGKKAKYHIISRDTGYQSSIDFAKEYFRIEVNKAESIKEAIEGKPPKLLLEDNPKFDDDNTLNSEEPTKVIPSSSPTATTTTTTDIESIREEIERKLTSHSRGNISLDYTQLKQLSSLLTDKTTNTRKIVNKKLELIVGKKKAYMIPTILELCKEYIRD
jgi:hypothetical protein